MMRHVFTDQACDEVVRMVVARLQARFHRLAGGFAGVDEPFGHQLLVEELVGIAGVDEDRCRRRFHTNQLLGIVGGPGVAIVAEVRRERLLAPWGSAW